MRYREALAEAASRLAEAGIGQPVLDARRLLQHAAGVGHAALIARSGEDVPAGALEAYSKMIARRLGGEPVSRIAGVRAFFGLELQIGPEVLDPRPETEVLVSRVLDDIADREAPLAFADVGTGSGAIAVALLGQLPAARCVAGDVSPGALAIAGMNARNHGVGDRMETVACECLDAMAGPFDFIVSNPPYIPSGDIASLAREVRLHDPRLALDGGSDGLSVYRALAAQAGGKLKPGGRLYLEIGAGQAGDVAQLAAGRGWLSEGTVADLAGIERVLVLRRP
ncbi:MAG: peptide chain release factor N(5)-glutamine methyltransferase [Pseudomonadota bacterium]|nr:peptide chain release factor N(5)-glutamine methyltransferase [Pseudomonadota bacterium]